MKPTPTSGASAKFKFGFALFAGLLGLSLSLLFYRGWGPNHLVFSNDGPLGVINTKFYEVPSAFFGMWTDSNWLGTSGGCLSPGFSAFLRVLLGPVWFSKLFASTALFLLGIGAWFFFRELGFNKTTCGLGGLAAAINGEFVCTACWGVAGQPICFALCYLAMGLVANMNDRPWARTALAGLCVGMGVIEAADIGAIFSVFVAAWVAVHALVQEGTTIQKIARGSMRLALVAGCAAFIASSALTSFVGTQIKGVVGMEQDAQTKAMRWGEATQWSLPKREMLDVLVPGFFGFRMDTPMYLPESMQKSHTGGAYWGFSGRDASWDAYLETDKKSPIPGGMMRYGMGAGYAGMLVLVVAAWAAVQSLRGQKSFFSAAQRKLIWFWLAVMVLATGMMFGRFAPKFAPLYELFYALPGASMIRNPAKFLHVFEWALIVIFGYGLHGLTTLYLERATATTRGVLEQFGIWWKQPSGFDKKWVLATLGGLVLACVAWFCLSGMRGKVEAYVAEMNQFAMIQQGNKPDPVAAADAATTTVDFSLRQVRWAVVALAVTVGLLALLVSGAFAGKRARLGSILLGLLLTVDLGWQARPWVIAQNWKERYVEAGNNPVFDFLRNKPFEHRISNISSRDLRPFRLDPRLLETEGWFQSLYGSEWTQHLFPYNNIQTLSVVQMPRRPLDYDVFESVLLFDWSTNTLHHVARRWELTSTRYIACAAPLMSLLNQGFDPGQQRFQPRMLFEFYQDRRGGPILIRTNNSGPYAIIEFTGALPRAKLYTDWQAVPYDAARIKQWTDSFPPNYPMPFGSLSTNDLATVELLTRASFNPAQTVLLAEPLKIAPATNTQPGTVEYTSYSPKHIVLKTRATAPSVLLLNDRYDPAWQVLVDGKPAPLLRCNYLMRGVQLEQPGAHTVEFVFRQPLMPLYVSVAAIGFGILLIAYLALASRQAAASARSTT